MCNRQSLVHRGGPGFDNHIGRCVVSFHNFCDIHNFQHTLHPHDLGLVPSLVISFINGQLIFFSLHSASDRLQTNPDPVIEVSTPVVEVDLCEEEASTNA